MTIPAVPFSRSRDHVLEQGRLPCPPLADECNAQGPVIVTQSDRLPCVAVSPEEHRRGAKR